MPDRWDYLTFDPARQRVFVSHGDEVSVVDGIGGKVVGTLADLPGSHGIAVAGDLNSVFADSAKDKALAAFDAASLARAPGVASAGDDADGVAYDAQSHRVFVADGDAAAVTIVDGTKNAFVATLPLGGKPEFLVADGQGHVYVNVESTREIAVIDAKSAAILKRFAIPDCESPHGLAVDAANKRLFTTCENGKMFVVDAESGQILARLPIGAHTDAAGFDPARKLAFSSNGDGTLSVIAEKDADDFVALGNVPTVPGGRTMTLDPATGRIYVVAADVDHIDPPKVPGGRPHIVYKPGTLKLYFFDPAK